MCRNEPNVHKSEKLDNTDHWHGAQLSVTIEGNWSNYRSKILKYLRQIAVITPYAQFSFDYKADDDKNNMKLLFKRRTDVMPPAPKVRKAALLAASWTYNAAYTKLQVPRAVCKAVGFTSGNVRMYTQLSVTDCLFLS